MLWGKIRLACWALLLISFVILNNMSMTKVVIISLYFITFLISNIVSVFIHEFSHFCFFSAFKFKVKRISIGMLTWTIYEERVRLTLEKKPPFSGECSCEVDKNKKKNTIAYAASLMAGGVTNLVIGLILLMLFSRFITNRWAYIAICQAVACLINFFVNIVIPISPDRVLLRIVRKNGS